MPRMRESQDSLYGVFMLKLVAKNSDSDIINHKLEKQVNYYACRKCKHRWTATIGQMMDSPKCPKCGK